MEVIGRRRGIAVDRDRFDHELSRRGLTARRLSQLSGIPEPTLSRVRHGATVTDRTLRRITEALLAQPLVIGFDLLIADPAADHGDAA